MTTLFITVVLIVFLASCVHGLLLDTNTDPCSYSNYSIDCSSHGLISIPVFNLTRYTAVCFREIVLSNNKLTIIENDAFSQLSSLNCSYTIRLSNNNMSQINEYAFRGIEAHVEGLYLDTNSLHSLPEALGSIINLKLLRLSNNPIVSLNPSVMAKIGHSLDAFFVEMASFQQWPIELHLLYELGNLYLYDIPFQSLNSDAFRGLTHVHWLTIANSNLKKIPNAVCALPALFALEITGNNFLNQSKSDVFEPCNNVTGMPRLGILNYIFNRVDYFPNFVKAFPSVNTVYMYGNGIRFMDADKFEDNFSVWQLVLFANQFRRIPSGLSIFKRLNELDLHNNLIECVEDNDLIGLRSLTNIKLSYNPIQFITNKSFQNNIQLVHVDLSRTFLTTIPAAVTMLPALKDLRFEETDIECTCELANLKSWNVSSIQIDGLCYETSERIEHFIKTYIDAGKCLPVQK